MKRYTLIILSSMILISCETKKGEISDTNSQIVLVTNKSENIYLTQSLNNFSKVSVVAKIYIEKLLELETKAAELKTLLEKQQIIPKIYQENFINSFAKSLDYINASDSTDLELLKIISITSSEDIDQLLLFMKRSYVKNLSGKDRYLFNMIGTSAEVENLNIKNGETFSATMNITATNTNKPAEWYILKDASYELTKENVSDTLLPDKFGSVVFKTKRYKIGDNRIVYVTKIPSTRGEVTLSKAIDFKVH